MHTPSTTFSTRVLERYDNLRNPNTTLKARAVGESLQTGHPLYNGLLVGERRSCEMASLFLDLTNFTGRTYWDDPGEVADLAHAVLSGFTEIVDDLGGHVLGLRGDGLFAGFGPSADPRVSVALAAAAAAASLDAVANSLNPALKSRGIEPLQARAGADYGTAVFMRTGTDDVSEININGFATNFAAKCEKYADSWEVVVGESFAGHILNTDVLSQREGSPKRFTRDGETKPYKYFDYSWKPVLSEVESAMADLAGRSLETV
jgi:adenylate cyclase